MKFNQQNKIHIIYSKQYKIFSPYIIFRNMTTVFEIDRLLERKPNAQTQANYRNIYKKLFNIIQKPINETDQEYILIVLDEISNANVSNELTYLNIPILLKQLYNKDYSILDKRRNFLKEVREKDMKVVKEIDLPAYNNVREYINGLSKSNQYRKYIVNYLIFTYGVRNKDCNVFITTRDTLKSIDTNMNYLLVKKTEIEWIRNDYKTITSHLQQRIVIKAKKFVEAVKSLPINTWLLSGTDKPISESSLTNTIARMLYLHNDKNMTESDYFKLNIKHLQSQPNSYTKIMTLGVYRGTNPETIEKYYNVLK